MKRKIFLAILVLISLKPVWAAQDSDDIAKIKASCKLHGGLCIAAGVDVDFAAAIARECGMYVHLIAPDVDTAQTWLQAMQSKDQRMDLASICPTGNGWPYARDLANFIVVKGPNDCPSPEELKRILAPGGIAAIQGQSEGFSASAVKLGLAKSQSSSWLILQKAKYTAAEDWMSIYGSAELGNSAPNSSIQPTMGLRWRAGPRWMNRYSNYGGMVCGDGVFLYREVSLVPGRAQFYQRVLIGRDAFNGRELWRVTEDPISPPMDGFSETLFAASEGKVLISINGKPTCIDAHTGNVDYVLTRPGNQSARFASIYQRYLICAGGNGLLSVHALNDGKVLWSTRISVHQMAAVHGKAVYAAVEDKTGVFIKAWDLESGSELWSHATAEDEVPEPSPATSTGVFCSGGGVHYQKFTKDKRYLLGLDFSTGKKLWMAEADNPKTVFPGSKDMSESLSVTAFENEIWYQFKKGEKIGYTVHMTSIDAKTGAVLKKNFSMHNGDTHCWKLKGAGEYLLYSKNQFVKRDDMSVTANGLVRSICSIGHIPGSRQLFMLPHNCRCGTLIRGIVAMGAPETDVKFNPKPSLVAFKGAPATTNTIEADWPMYRHDAARSSSVPFSPGKKLKEAWKAKVGGADLTQAVSGYGMVYVSDGQGQRVVALDMETGAIKWTFPTGSRMHYPPVLYKGLCLVATNGGWVIAVDANTGAPRWKLMIAPAEHYIGGEERFESLWPVKGDVLISNGVAYAGAGHAGTIDGGVQLCAFDPISGTPTWNKIYTDSVSADLLVEIPNTKKLLYMGTRTVDPESKEISPRAVRPKGGLMMADFGFSTGSLDDYFMSSDRNQVSQRRERLGDGVASALLLAFTQDLRVCVDRAKAPSATLKDGKFPVPDLRLYGTKDGKNSLWDIPNLGLNVDGLIVGPDAVYCAGHSLVDDSAAGGTVLVLNPLNGEVLQEIKLKDAPVFDGMSATRGRLLLVTESGEVVCYKSE